MSIRAIDWVYRTKIGSPQLKCVLAAMADYANSFGQAYPSTEQLARKVEMSPRTIIRALDQLQAGGFIEDTGKRVGKTKQIKVYRLAWADEEKDCQSDTLSKTDKIEGKDCQPEHERLTKRSLGLRGAAIGSKNGGNRQEPSGTISRKAALVAVELAEAEKRKEWADRLATIYHRKVTTPWSVKEVKAFAVILPIDDDSLCMIERRYAAEWPPREGNTLRRDLLTFLNNYRGEEDRALSWAEKHPVRSKTLRAPISLHSEAPPPDPAAQAKFLEDFKRVHGRLPYGYTENGKQ